MIVLTWHRSEHRDFQHSGRLRQMAKMSQEVSGIAKPVSQLTVPFNRDRNRTARDRGTMKPI